jgi:predicted RNA-binding Zn-ribbon protein involved in translation (DUF1610 family)
VSGYKFSEAEKVSIWQGDERRCFYCREPVPYSELQIDHIVPETISSDQLAKLQSSVLPTNFEINSICNWVTCHQGCNNRKSSFEFDPNTIGYYVGMASKRSDKVQKIMDDFEVEKKNGTLLSTLKVRLEKGYLSRAAVLVVLGDLPAPTHTESDPWVVAFGANFYDALPINTPERDPQRSDWLLEQLGRDLSSTDAVFRKIDDDRSGEGVSVRYAFWLLDLDRATANIDICWNVLTVQKYSELFQTSADDLLDRAVVSRYHQIVYNAPIGDPVGISACPDCGSTDIRCESFSNSDDTIYEVTCNECGNRTTS